MGKRNLWFLFSGLIIVVGLVSLLWPGRGLNLGIDFTGGSYLDLHFSQPVTTQDIRGILDRYGLGTSIIQLSPNNKDAMIRTTELSDETRRQLLKDLESKYGPFEKNIDLVRPVISQGLIRSAIWALVIANLGMLVYIAFRFEFRFGVAGILALLHDVLITLGLTSLLRIPVDSPFIAAILTIVGYSINDTIVIFDRIRDNLKQRRKEPLIKIVNDSINQTLTRSIFTVVTVLLSLIAIWVFGGEPTRDLAEVLFIGILSGAYSSIFIASPIWYIWKQAEEGRRLATKSSR